MLPGLSDSHAKRRLKWSFLKGMGGFTLVEMMIALVVLGIGLTALAQSLPRSLSMRDRARRMSVATNLAQQELERLRDLDYNAADLAPGNHTSPDNPIDGVYRRRWEVLADSPIPDMKTLTVSVSFPVASADSQATLVTRVSR